MQKMQSGKISFLGIIIKKKSLGMSLNIQSLTLETLINPWNVFCSSFPNILFIRWWEFDTEPSRIRYSVCCDSAAWQKTLLWQFPNWSFEVLLREGDFFPELFSFGVAICLHTVIWAKYKLQTGNCPVARLAAEYALTLYSFMRI